MNPFRIASDRVRPEKEERRITFMKYGTWEHDGVRAKWAEQSGFVELSVWNKAAVRLPVSEARRIAVAIHNACDLAMRPSSEESK